MVCRRGICQGQFSPRRHLWTHRCVDATVRVSPRRPGERYHPNFHTVCGSS
jgi:hypothetical protein